MSTEKDTVLEVQGMSSPSSIRYVTSALLEIDGVAKIDVLLRDGLVIVKHDNAQATITHLIDALNEAGYASRERL